MIGVILAAGDGTRLTKSTGQNICKPLKKINNKHLLEYSLDNLVELEANEVYVVVGKQGDLIKEAFGNEYKGLNVHYVYQQEQKGLMNAFVEALNVMNCDETVILQLSDEIFIDLKIEEIKKAIQKDFDFYCGITFEDDIEKIKNNFSVETDDKSKLIKCVEKPKIVTNNIKGTGFTIFNAKTLEVIKANTELHDLCDSFNYLTETGYGGHALNIAEKEFNINTLDDLAEAENYLK